VPYLAAEPERVAMWRQRLGTHGFKVGIAWQGNPTSQAEQGRSIPLGQFARLAQRPDLRLISLQRHHGLNQLDGTGGWLEQLGDDFDAGSDAFVDTAAVMECLDLVVSSDTAVPHLAGALGRPVWVALQRVPDWRWMLDRSDTPWYPSMRLFRQQRRGDWDQVFADMAEALG
jgi:ADP-heptose:LPS heptosyltransferase